MSAYLIIRDRLRGFGVAAVPPLPPEGELWRKAGEMLAAASANIVVELRANPHVRAEKRVAAIAEALEFAALSDMCMARADAATAKKSPTAGS